jgi:hypothetical protein
MQQVKGDEMITTTPQSKLDSVELDLDQTQARLNQLERHEWWRWSIAFFVMLVLTFGLFALSLSVRGGLTWQEQAQLNITLRGLLALVLLFDVFVVHQQMLITRLRRDLATQLRVFTTLDILKKADMDATSPHNERRRLQRVGIDRRVRVNVSHEGKPTCVHGRIRDISEEGMGAVIPCSLSINEQVTLEFSIENGHEETVSAVVRHRRGFLYGFDFVSIEPSLREVIARVTEPTAAVVDRPLPDAAVPRPTPSSPPTAASRLN